MLAALITGKQQLELCEFPEPHPAAEGVVVDIAYCGICGTDVHAYQSGIPQSPAICGHEWAGTVSAVGSDVSGLAEGDRVVGAVPPACGDCDPCRAGQRDRCLTTLMVATGLDEGAPPHGGFAPKVSVAASRVVKTEPGLSDEQAAFVEPATVTFHAVRSSRLHLGDVAVVQGAGPIGLLTMQWVRAAGAGAVVVIEPHAGRRELARQLGADAVSDPGGEAQQTVLQHTGGLGADIAYECVGRPDSIQSAADLVRRGGALCLIGMSEQNAWISPTTWLLKEISLTSALAYLHEEFRQAMRMMADGRVRVDPLHTSTAKLEGIDEAFADLARGQSEQTKVLVRPGW